MNLVVFTPFGNYNENLKKIIPMSEYNLIVVDNEEFFFETLSNLEMGIVLYDTNAIDDYELKIYDILEKKKPETYMVAMIDPDDRFSLSEALRMGIDDYIYRGLPYSCISSKLFAIKRNILHYEKYKSLTKYRLKNIVLDVSSRTVKKDNVIIDLTNREFELLQYLLQNKNRVISRDELKKIFDMEAEENTNIIEVYINFLRKKLSKNGTPDLIKTIRGIGYTIQER